jgi:hypothetical protein
LHPNAQPLEEARRQLTLLLEQQESLAPGLYRDLALYLQVLREVLLPAVQQACFHLATQVVPDRYGQLPQERRQQFQQRLVGLVQRCTALLTVEQLMGLAAQQQRRDHRRQAAEHRRLLSAFLEGRDDTDPSDGTEASSAEPSTPERPPVPGSVSLGLDLPVSADLLDRGIPGLAGTRAAAAATEAHDPSGSGSSGSELKLLQSLFSLAAEGMGLENGTAAEAEPGTGSGGHAADEPSTPALLTMAARVEGPDRLDPLVTGSSLPRDPLLQLSWWRHWDAALHRRLRNLSHALNVEMMRLGLAQGLLPLNLLDAVLEGQVEALPAPANLLRLPLPLPQLAGGPSEVLAVLLRTTDLEFQQPRLRTCRKRLEQRRRALRTMAKRYRIWQRRVTALEAEQQWFRDSAQLQNPTQPAG